MVGVETASKFYPKEEKKNKTFLSGYLFDNQKDKKNANFHRPTIV